MDAPAITTRFRSAVNYNSSGGSLMAFSMVEKEVDSGLDKGKLQEIKSPDCFPCKIIGAGACLGSSFYLFFNRNTFGQSQASRSVIVVVAASESF